MKNHVKVVWNKDIQFVAQDDLGHHMILDGDPGANHPDEGFRPSHLLMIALVGCTGMDVVSILRKMNHQVSHFEVETTGEHNDEYPKKYHHMHVTYHVTGKAIKESDLQHAIALSETKYCIVRNTLAPSVEITSSYTLTES